MKTNKKKSYGVYHKKTKLWVYFKEYKDKFGLIEETIICLCLKSDATTYATKKKLNDLLLLGNFNSVPGYGKDNKAEFQIKNV